MTLHILSAGAAQSVVEQTIAAWRGEKGDIVTSYGAVGAQKRKLLEGTPADVVILTAAMIDELIAAGHLVAGSRADLGAVVGGIAVPRGARHPAVASETELAASLRAAAALYIPDPQTATAGAQFVAMCEKLGIAAEARAKLRTFPNGFAAMTRMAEERLPDALGCTQVTEIKWVQGVELVAPLPRSLQVPTVYALAIAVRGSNPVLAQEFVAQLTGAQAAPMLARAGFGLR